MKLIQFVLSILLAICAICMLYGAITNYSPMKTFSMVIITIILLSTFALVRLTYKELK